MVNRTSMPNIEEHKAKFRIDPPGIIAGSLPAKAAALVMEWLLLHQQELRDAYAEAGLAGTTGKILLSNKAMPAIAYPQTIVKAEVPPALLPQALVRGRLYGRSGHLAHSSTFWCLHPAILRFLARSQWNTAPSSGREDIDLSPESLRAYCEAGRRDLLNQRESALRLRPPAGKKVKSYGKVALHRGH